MTTTQQAVATRDNSPSGLLAAYQGEFATVIPATGFKAETFVRLAQGLLKRDRNLARVATQNPASFFSALLECARLGHEPGTSAYYLVPFGNEVTGIEGYKGKIDRIYRAGAVASIIAEVVHANDTFKHSPASGRPPVHEVDWDSDDRGEMRLAYAYAVMKDGSNSRVVVMNKTQIEKHRKESRGSDKAASPWVKWPESMWLKTVIHELEKWVPSSSEYREEMLRAKAAAENTAIPGAKLPQIEGAGDDRPAGPPATAPEGVDDETGEIGPEYVEAEVMDGELPPEEPW